MARGGRKGTLGDNASALEITIVLVILGLVMWSSYSKACVNNKCLTKYRKCLSETVMRDFDKPRMQIEQNKCAAQVNKCKRTK